MTVSRSETTTQAEAGPAPFRLPAATTRQAPSLAQRRVLIACSEPAPAETFASLLRHHAADLWPTGLEIRHAVDGISCLRIAQHWKPDLLLIQPQLDRMSGAEVVETWRRTHPDLELRVVALSALFGSDVPEQLGASRVVELPCEGSALVDAVAAALA